MTVEIKLTISVRKRIPSVLYTHFIDRLLEFCTFNTMGLVMFIMSVILFRLVLSAPISEDQIQNVSACLEGMYLNAINLC